MLSEIKQMSASTILAVTLSTMITWAVAQFVRQELHQARETMIERFDKTNERIDALMLEMIQANILDDEIDEAEAARDIIEPSSPSDSSLEPKR